MTQPPRSLPRFFVTPQAIAENIVTIVGDDAHKIARVLRLKPGDEIAVLDNTGARYHCKLLEVGGQARAETLYKTEAHAEPRTHITIAQALAKGDKLEQVIQHATEVGVSRFLILKTDRCVVQLEPAKAANRLKRWQTIAMEAAEQANRSIAPPVEGVRSLKEALEQTADTLRVFLYEGEGLLSLKSALADSPSRITLFVGPEGGFTRQEVALAQEAGSVLATLGPRVLRTETAGLVAASQVLFALEPDNQSS